MYKFTLQVKTWTYHKKVTASDGTADDDFGRSFSISRDMLIVGYYEKYDYMGRGVYSFVLAGDRLWDEGTRLITTNAIASDY